MSIGIYKVARKHHKVGLLTIDSLNKLGYEFRALQEGADMDVGELQDAIAMECRRQSGRTT